MRFTKCHHSWSQKQRFSVYSEVWLGNSSDQAFFVEMHLPRYKEMPQRGTVSLHETPQCEQAQHN